MYHIWAPQCQIQLGRAQYPGDGHRSGLPALPQGGGEFLNAVGGCFGRMEKRFEEMSAGRMVKSIESATGKQLSDTERRLLVRGADEEDLVNSGLEETMSVAYQQIMAVQRRHVATDFRTAAFITAIEKIAVSYMELGIFP